MIGTVEIFELSTGRLVFTDGFAPVAQPASLMEPADYIVVRRFGPMFIPRSAILAFSLNEFLHWHFQGFAIHEAFTDISRRDIAFLIGMEIHS